MSRRKNRKHRQSKQQQKVLHTRRYLIPLADWKRYERFKEILPHVEEALADLQENWTSHTTYLVEELQITDSEYTEDLGDTVVRLIDLIKGLEGESYKSKRRTYCEQPKMYDSSANYVSNRPKRKYENMMAEILIEEIGDGNV